MRSRGHRQGLGQRTVGVDDQAQLEPFNNVKHSPKGELVGSVQGTRPDIVIVIIKVRKRSAEVLVSGHRIEARERVRNLEIQAFYARHGVLYLLFQ